MKQRSMSYQNTNSLPPDLTGTPDTVYLILSHPECGTSRAYVIKQNLGLLLSSQYAFSIEVECEKCRHPVRVDLLRGKEFAPYTYSVTPVDTPAISVEDGNPMKRTK